MKKVVIQCIRAYQGVQWHLRYQRLPMLFMSGCRSWPTCSEYTIQAVEKHGVLRGLVKGFKRIIACNPLFKPQY